MAACSSAGVFAIRLAKCDHSEAQSLMTSVPHNTVLSDLIQKYHGPIPKGYVVATSCQKELHLKDSFSVDPNLCIGDLKQTFDIKVIEFTCKGDPNEKLQTEEILRKCGQEATKTAANAFQLLMAGGRAFPQKKGSK